jgi:hypothetical protein
MPQREHVYRIVGTEEYIRFKKIVHKWTQGTEGHSTTCIEYDKYVLNSAGNLVSAPWRVWTKEHNDILKFNGMKLEYVGEWSDMKPTGNKTLDDRLRECGDDVEAILRLLSRKTYRKPVNVYYGNNDQRFTIDGVSSPIGYYVHHNETLGYYMSNQQVHGDTRRYSDEPRTATLSMLTYDLISRIVVQTTKKRKFVWERSA